MQKSIHRRNGVYDVALSRKVGRSYFDLSYSKTFTCDLGQLIPVMCDLVMPGDFLKLSNEMVIRFQPMVAPVLHQINAYVHYFFVPFRLLWPEGEDGSFVDFITGGVDGDDASVLPTWEPTNTAIGSLWDYMGFPTGVDPDGFYPMDFPRRAYAMVYNEYYRDETLQSEVALTNESILNRCWEKDYYTSALLEQQRGIALALPITIGGSSSAVWTNPVAGTGSLSWPAVSSGDPQNMTYDQQGGGTQYQPGSAATKTALEKGSATVSIPAANLNANSVPGTSFTATSFDVADLRQVVQTQRWMERNMRCGVRYTEFCHAHFGASPRDDRLQRPEYIGGSKSPVIISEVLQTSKTDGTAAQGNMAGHGITANQSYCGKYHVQEFGLIIGLLSVMPRSMYQQGINKQWVLPTRYDWPFPEFAHLSEQAVLRGEIYADGVSANNNTLFGYQGRYNEHRAKQNMVCGQMRTTYDYWHLSRQFGAAPTLDGTFVTCTPRKDFLAAPSEPAMLISFGNVIHSYRPLPVYPDPGYMDH